MQRRHQLRIDRDLPRCLMTAYETRRTLAKHTIDGRFAPMPVLRPSRADVSEADTLAREASDAEGGILPFIRPGLYGEVVPEEDLRPRARCRDEGRISPGQGR